MNNTIHPLSDVQSTKIGDETRIWQYTVVLPRAEIGRSCNIAAHCFIENDVTIGDNVTVKCGVYIWDGIVIEDNAFIAANVTFINDMYPRSKAYDFILKPTLVKQGASIGAGSTIMGGITIGEYSMIGAGSLITKNVPAHTLVFGNPGTVKGYICECSARLDAGLTCPECNKRYNIKDGQVSHSS